VATAQTRPVSPSALDVAVANPSHGGFSRLARRFAPTWPSRLGWVLVAVVLLAALIGPYVAPYPADISGATHILISLQAPSAAHPFGTNEVGQDVLTLVLAGARTSLAIAFGVVLIALLIGVAVGLVAGYYGGAAHHALMGLTDVFLALPALPLAITVAGLLGPGIPQLVAVLALVWWPGNARLVAIEVQALRHREFVEAARATGAPSARIMLRHVLPSVVSPLLVKVSLDLGYVILTAAGLGFIGLGVQPPTPEWGSMVADSRQYMIEAWWYTLYPGLAIFVAVAGFSLVGDAMRDALDPHRGGSAGA
jgi:peptide/nickel transport system permease protein